MPTRPPTREEIAHLVSFLPVLYADGFEPVIQWFGGTKGEDGVWTMPYPEYHPSVDKFFAAAAAEPWLDYQYRAATSLEMLETPGLVESASLDQIKTMLTWCVRGERFIDGHRESAIKLGHIRRLLERLAAILEEDAS